jgi:dihydropteroate synthase
MFTLNCNGVLFSPEKPVVMGILNITPDSFYAPSRPKLLDELVEKAGNMISDGAQLMDIGAQSTRPGSEWIDATIEWERLAGLLPILVKRYPGTLFSIDTFHHTVAEKAVDAGACIVNDVSAGKLDDKMITTVARLGVPFVAMHMKGTPQTMSSLTEYHDLRLEVVDYFIERINTCRNAGIKDIIIDPGFGFAKKGQQNFELLYHLQDLHILGCPVLLGVSRKSMVTRALGITADEALNGTTVLHTIGLTKGASILRVHDVKEAMQAIDLVEALKCAGHNRLLA